MTMPPLRTPAAVAAPPALLPPVASYAVVLSVVLLLLVVGAPPGLASASASASAPPSAAAAAAAPGGRGRGGVGTFTLPRPPPRAVAAFCHHRGSGGGSNNHVVGNIIPVPPPVMMSMAPPFADDPAGGGRTAAARGRRPPRRMRENEPTYDRSSRHSSRPADSLSGHYDEVVRSAHVRHVLLETDEMADLALRTLFGGDAGGGSSNGEESSSDDPFGDLARSVSACAASRDDGGRVGWIDNPRHHHGSSPSATGASSSSTADVSSSHHPSPLLPDGVVRRLFELRPRGGDVHLIKSDGGPVHIVRVDDLHVDYLRGGLGGGGDGCGDGDGGEEGAAAAAGRNRVITNRSKLPGVGIRPNAPAFDFDFDVAAASPAAPTVTSKEGQRQPMAKTYHISTVGCQMNVADSERMAGVLDSSLNLTPTPMSKDADVVILNTCSIRDHAEQKLYDQLGPHAARKRRGEHVALVVSGCVAQQEGEDLLRRVPEIDAVVGPQYAARLGDVLDDVSRGHQVVATDPTLLTEDMSRPVRGSDVRAWVNVIHGCNEHCTYCVVPHVRGVEQSRSMESILDEVRDLGRRGYGEVTLLGQNIDAYGRDMTPRRTFADLLRYLNDHIGDGVGDGGGIRRIRYVTSHPRYFSDRVIDAVAELDRVCECFHMPFQSGDDDVLRRMRRGYTHGSYMKIIDKIRERAPDASICGDVIVGFPGESDAAFQRTLDLMDEVKFDNLNTFAYSARPNTEAANWTNQIPDEVKSERLQIVQRLAVEHARERSQRYLGGEVEVLVEERNSKNPKQVMGRTRQGRPVFFHGDIDELVGKLVLVKITEARPWSLTGSLL